MKLRLVTLLLIIPLLAADQDKEAAAKKDQDKLQGTWVVVAAERDGQSLDRIRGGKLAIAGNGFTIQTATGFELKGTFMCGFPRGRTASAPESVGARCNVSNAASLSCAVWTPTTTIRDFSRCSWQSRTCGRSFRFAVGHSLTPIHRPSSAVHCIEACPALPYHSQANSFSTR